MDIRLKGVISEGKLKSDGIRIVIEASEIDNLENLRHLMDKIVDIHVFSGQKTLSIET